MGGVGLIALLAACGSDPPVISCNDIGAGACTGARGVAQPSIEPTTHAIVLSAPTARRENLAAPIALAGGTIRITEVRFDGDSTALSTTEEQRLRALVSQLGDLGPETIRVTGFTERPGLSQDQASLADQRAGAVVWALQMLHVDAQRLDAGREGAILPTDSFPGVDRGVVWMIALDVRSDSDLSVAAGAGRSAIILAGDLARPPW